MGKADFAHNFEDLKDDLDELKEVVSELLGSDLNTNVARRRIKRNSKKTLRHLGNTYRDARQSGFEALSAIQQQLVERPVASAIGSFAAGLIIGRFFRKN